MSVAESALLSRIGTRVRTARKGQNLSRRALSDRCGVSMRYLAQLEVGEGNISIVLLHRVSGALNLVLSDLVAEDPRQDTDRICLVGLRGAGKSTLGKALAARRNVPFVELTGLIEQRAGMPLSEIIALYGQSGLRRLEDEAVDDVIARHPGVVLAVAGGIVEAPETYARVLAGFRTIWLRASPAEHMDRVRAQGDTRPMQGNPAAMEQLRAILGAREAEYARADLSLDTSGATPGDSLLALEHLIKDPIT